MQAYWAGAVACALLAASSVYADTRRTKRRNLDRVGMISWPLVQVLAMMGTVIFAAFALTG